MTPQDLFKNLVREGQTAREAQGACIMHQQYQEDAVILTGLLYTPQVLNQE